MSRRHVALLLAAAVSLSACGGSDETSGVATTSTAGGGPATTGGSDASPTGDVPEQLDFTAPDIRGGQVVGADLAGQDLVIWFWAPW